MPSVTTWELEEVGTSRRIGSEGRTEKGQKKRREEVGLAGVKREKIRTTRVGILRRK